MKSANNASIGNIFFPDIYVTIAISNARVLKRLPMDSRVHLLEVLCMKLRNFSAGRERYLLTGFSDVLFAF